VWLGVRGAVRARLLPFRARGRASALPLRLTGKQRAVSETRLLIRSHGRRFTGSALTGPPRPEEMTETADALRHDPHTRVPTRPAMRWGGETRSVGAASASLVVKAYPKRDSQHCG
jgi:hypothetical protein